MSTQCSYFEYSLADFLYGACADMRKKSNMPLAEHLTINNLGSSWTILMFSNSILICLPDLLLEPITTEGLMMISHPYPDHRHERPHEKDHVF